MGPGPAAGAAAAGRRGRERRRRPGTLAAHVDQYGDVDYYTTRKPKERARSEREEVEARDRRERDRAIKARAVVCAQIAQAGPPAMPTGGGRQVADVLAIALLRDVDAETLRLAWTLLHPDAKPDRNRRPFYDWRDQLLGAGDDAAAQRDRITAAYAAALAQDEGRARWTYSNWAQPEIDHLARLQAAGYEPTEWEQERLAQAAQYLEEDRAERDADTGAAAGEPAAAAAACGWLLNCTPVDGWSLWQLGTEPDDPDALDLVDAAGDDITEDDVPAAHAWAADVLATQGHQVDHWQAAIDVTGFDVPSWTPVFTT